MEHFLKHQQDIFHLLEEVASSGATTTFSAATALIFLTAIVSPIAIPELFLPSPSIF